MSDVSQWSTTAANNASTPPDGFPENQAPSTVNDSAREVMAAIAAWYADLDGTLTSGGSSGAYTLTTNMVHAALADQSMLVFRANHASENGHTLNVDSLGAKTLVGGPILANQIVVASYNATNDEYDMIGPFRNSVGSQVATTSGTTVTVTSAVPSWARKIILPFNDVNTNAGSALLVQLGDSGGFEITGYISNSNTLESTAGFIINRTVTAQTFTGHMILTNITGNTWIESHVGRISSGSTVSGGGSKTLTGTLTQIRLNTSSGTDTFDSGAVNVMFE